ncbi:DUF6088 family protein [Porticoccus sp. GXU_MW_L64]
MKTLESKIRYRVSRRKESVFTPKDFLDLSDRDQVGRVLRKLVAEESLIKLGYGLYARTRKSSVSGKTIPEKGLPDLAREALIKLGVTLKQSSGEREYNSGNTTQVPTGRVIGVKGRISRKIGYNGKYITLEHVT